MRADWEAIEPLIDAALELSLEDRASLLERECTTDPDLRRRVEEFLASCDQERGFLEIPAVDFVAELVEPPGASDSSHSGRIVGPYRLMREIGRGGMGTVWLAERADGHFEQRVALKLIKRGMDSDEIHRRFLAERQILARLDHPNIARLVDGGVALEGQPWFAMEHVDGVPIMQHADAHGLSRSDRVRLFESACEAVHYAHQNLIVHRDLKPSNILVTKNGIVKLLDFGIAKILDDTSGESAQTGTGLRAMTPEYAAPEQVRMEAITTATDVYALGAVLYEILTGRKAHILHNASPLEIERVVCEVEPVPPRTGTDLDTIVLKALQKDPARRYATADALLDDLRRYESGRPVRARPDTVGYRLGKFVRRHRMGVIASTAILLALVAAIVATATQARVARREAGRAREVKELLIGLFQGASPAESRGADVTVREILDRGAGTLDSSLAREPELRAELLDVMGGIYFEIGLYSRADSFLTRSVRLSESVLGKSDTTVAKRLARLAGIAQLETQWPRAESLLVRALHVQERQQGRNHPDVAVTLAEMANLKRLRVELDESETLYSRAISIVRNSQPVDQRRLALFLTAQAHLRAEAGRHAAADTACSEALSIQRRILDPDHPEMIRTIRVLSNLRTTQGNLVDAEALAREVVERRRRLYPEGSPILAESIGHLASILNVTGRLSEAEVLYRETLALRRRLLGPAVIETIISMNSVAGVRLEMGDVAFADSLFEEAFRLASLRGLGEENRTVLWMIFNRGLVLREQGRFSEAERSFQRAADGRRKLFGNDHPTLGQSLIQLGAMQHKMGRSAEAAKTLSEAESIYRSVYPPVRHTWVALFNEYGVVLTDIGRARESERMLRDAVSLGLKFFGPQDLRVSDSRRALAAALVRLGRHDEAEKALRASYEDVKANPHGALRRQKALQALIAFYELRGRTADRDVYRRLLAGA